MLKAKIIFTLGVLISVSAIFIMKNYWILSFIVTLIGVIVAITGALMEDEEVEDDE